MEPLKAEAAPAVQGPPVHAPEDIAARLGEHPPTPEQAEVITAPLTPRLIMAGAGSGKTATMSDRVVWLVANGLARPDQVLGVTFTRKAAGELAHRIDAKVDALLRSGLEIPGFDGEPEDLGRAAVSTYHSYAGALVRDHGLRIGVEPEAALMGEADAHRMMADVARSHPVAADRLGMRPGTLVSAALRLAGDMSEHLVEPVQVRAHLEALLETGRGLGLPKGMKELSAGVQEVLQGFEDRALMADLVARYTEAKQERDVMDFGDLLRHAARIARDVPAAGEQERGRFPVVLLDEFQDTSHAQMQIFAGLFGPAGPADDAPGLGHCVTAVGDPHQSIYGFRGASAGQLFAFPSTFPRLEAQPDGTLRRVNADVSHLTVAWRNDRAVLAAANTVAAPLVEHAAAGSGSPIELRALRPRPGAGEGTVRVDRHVTQDEEAQDLARRLAELPATTADGRPLSRAVLCRARSQFVPVLAALDEAGLAYEVLGLSGLLSLPEVVEVLAVLHILADPSRNDHVVRLLTGPRWRIGPADLEVLNERARFVSRFRAARAVPQDGEAGGAAGQGGGAPTTGGGAPTTDAPSTAAPDVSPEEDTDAPALLEALDSLPGEGSAWVGSRGRGFSPEGLRRLREVNRLLRSLSASADAEPADLLAEVERAIGLDVEVALRPDAAGASARRHLNALQDAARGFAAGSGAATDLTAFLAWTASVEEHERGLGIEGSDPTPGVIQVLTVHASKGLEWDVVAVPGLLEGTFPSDRADRWTSPTNGALPWPLRGDAASLPQWEAGWAADVRAWAQSAGVRYSSKGDAESLPEPYQVAVDAHGRREERRLAYVAFTRARSALWLSAPAWKGVNKTAAVASDFLTEVAELAGQVPGVEIGRDLEEEDLPEENPMAGRTLAAWWPFDPLDGPEVAVVDPADPDDTGRWEPLPRRSRPRRAAVEEAAARVRTVDPEGLAADAEVEREVDWVLLRRRSIAGAGPQVALPSHVSVSLYGELAADPQAVAEQLRRPMPRPPAQAARRGTAFHAWLEERFGATGMLDIEDPTDAADQWVDDALDLAPLQEWFRSSRWADRVPAFVEAAVETTVAGITLRGRVDAVYRSGARPGMPFDPEADWEMVDWKTGAVPSARELEVKGLQLAVYRLAWSRLHGIPLENIRASFVYVAHGAERSPAHLPGEEELEAIITAALDRR